MMTGIKRLAAVFAAFSALVSCVSEAEDPDTVSNAREWAFIASLDGNDSRTLVKEDNKIWWSPSDSIRIFYGSQASGKFRSSNDNAVAVTKFTGTFDSAIGGIETGQNPLSFWGVYPYSEESVCDDASVTLRFPTEQEAVEGSFAPGAFPTVAKSDNLGLSFWIVGGGVRFTVERTGIRRAVFRSADGSPVSGVARVSFDDYGLPVVTDVSAPVDSVVVLAPKSGFVPGKAYFATMLPVTHKSGMRISVKTAITRGNGLLAKDISVRRAVFGRLDKIDSALEYVSDMPVPEMIDLGLSVKWASFNLGAESPEEYGEYFAWGETEPKADYSWSTYKWCYNGSSSKLTKYCTDASYGYNGFVDDKGVLDPEDDAATANLGGKWRMPTYNEWRELINNCSWTSATLGDVKGVKVMQVSTGNWIFLPFAGYCSGKSAYSNYSFYLASLKYLLNQTNARGLYMRSSLGASTSWYGITPGYSIRPVYGDFIHVTNVSLDKNKLTLAVGGSGKLTASVVPGNASESAVIWKSSDESIATVNEGVVTGVAAGTATITVKSADGGCFATCTVSVSNRVYVPEAVDLGLPSGLKWASFNLMASAPEEVGAYYAWGETEPKVNYSWSTYKWCKGSNKTMTKYCTESAYGNNGYTDDKGFLYADDDAASVLLGGDWRMPTSAEWQELWNNCNRTSATVNGVTGYKLSGKKDGYTNKSIFLPAAGYKTGTSISEASSMFYWSKSLYSLEPYYALGLRYTSYSSSGSRSSGFLVRAVKGDWIPVTGISLDKSSATLTTGGTVKLSAALAPSTASETGVIWRSSNESVATVSDGAVTGVAPGTATITAKSADGGYTATCNVSVNSRVYVPEAVDLGLPSGLKWASFNLMASAPEEFGAYYAWGETEPKVNYSWSTYKWCRGSEKTITKYCYDSAYGNNGYTDNKGVLDAEDDAAAVALGGKWRIPTYSDYLELAANCSSSTVTINGVSGTKYTSKVQGYTDKWIFLPSAGYKESAKSYSGFYYHTSTLVTNGTPAF